MTTSEKGIQFIKANEGYAKFPYIDVGRSAIGYGHDIQGNVPQSWQINGISLEDADGLLRSDLMHRFEPPLNTYLQQHGITLTQNQWDAWVDFAYNLGPTAAITMISHGVDQVPVQMVRWNHVAGQVNAGLTARRQAEVQLWGQA